MSRCFVPSLLVLVALGADFAAARPAVAGGVYCKAKEYTYVSNDSSAESGADAASNRVTYVAVQQTPQYDVRRPEVPSGARLTLFANFLGQTPGVVMLNVNGTSSRCQVVDWKPESVTAELPAMGLSHPQNAELVVIMPDGRIVKTFRVRLVAQPDIMVHKDTVPLPLPPAPQSQPISFAVPVAGGLLTYAQ
jgi:hypothetical protein